LAKTLPGWVQVPSPALARFVTRMLVWTTRRPGH
jgi:hypothetical protein